MKYSGNYFFVSAIDRLLEHSTGRTDLSISVNNNKEVFVESIIRNLENIFNTRSQTPAELYDANELTVLDFGMPDFGNYSPENIDDRTLLARRVKKAITSFEPRLTDVSIDFEQDMPDEKSLILILKAYMKIDTQFHEVTFLSKKQYSEANWDVYETIRK